MSQEPEALGERLWSVADLLRGHFRPSEYYGIILPLTVLRRFECVLAPTRQDVLDAVGRASGEGVDTDRFLKHVSGHAFYNTGRYSLAQIAAEPEDVPTYLRAYVAAFSKDAREVLERYAFADQVTRLQNADLLRQVIGKFGDLDLTPDTVSSHEMGWVFEDLVRRTVEQSEEAAGEHFTPHEVAQLMVDLLVVPDAQLLGLPGVVRSVFDPACGTGGLLIGVEERVAALNPEARIEMHGQEMNAETWAICQSGMMLRGYDPANIKLGNTIVDDRNPGSRFDYLITHPPFGVDWKAAQSVVVQEHAQGDSGRFGAGLPRINDSSFLFLQHMLSKMRPVDAAGTGGSRLAIILNGSPMHVGTAGTGESNIRKWIIESDWLETVIALPKGLFVSTGISTYLWLLTNRKPADRKGKVVLLNARSYGQKMRKPLGSKHQYLAPDQISEITQLYCKALSVANNVDHPLNSKVKVLGNDELGYQRITIEQPLRLRFEVSEQTLAEFANSRLVKNADDAEQLVESLRTLLGKDWPTLAKAVAALKRAVAARDLSWPSDAVFQRAVRSGFGLRDPKGEIQTHKGAPEPDPGLRRYEDLSLRENVDEYLRREVLPDMPDAWIDHAKTKIGYGIQLTRFFVVQLGGQFRSLGQFARLEMSRVPSVSSRGADEDRPFYLSMQNLHSANSAVELPDAPDSGYSLTPCSSGDLVGRPGNWRLLPSNFGEAVTSMYVLHPLPNYGRTLCEWLNSGNDDENFPTDRDVMNLQIPAHLVSDGRFGGLLDDIDAGRRRVRETTSSILPNVFSNGLHDVDELLKDTRSAAVEARLIGDLIRPLEDPVWRAEWSYPFHLAALARRYRIGTHPAEKKDGLLKLGEGIARILGILALTELVVKNGFTKALRNRLGGGGGATFGIWLGLIKTVASEIHAPKIQELSELGEHSDLYRLLEGIKDSRNDSAHAHGVRVSDELASQVEQLQPRVLSALNAVTWLSGTQWIWVERCEYQDESSYRLIGWMLRGSHPNWEPFDRPSTVPLRPERLYMDSVPSGTPVDLWPLATVSVCPECNVRELFLIQNVRVNKAEDDDDILILRSLEEHSIDIRYRHTE